MRDCSLLPNPHPIPIYPTDRDATKYCKWPCLFSTLLMHTSLAHTRGQNVSVHSCQNILNRKMRRLDLNFSAMFGEGKEKEDLWTIAGYVWCPESSLSFLPRTTSNISRFCSLPLLSRFCPGSARSLSRVCRRRCCVRRLFMLHALSRETTTLGECLREEKEMSRG